MKHLADPDSKDRALTLCGLPWTDDGDQRAACAACYLRTEAGYRQHLNNIARNLNDPRRPTALRILEGLDR